MSTFDDVTKNTGDIQKTYDEWKAGSLTPQKPTIKEIVAEQDGIDKNKIFKVKTITGEGGNDPNLAIDGKGSTSFEGPSLTLTFEGIAKVKAVGIKFKKAPVNEVKLQGTFGTCVWTTKFNTSGIKTTEFKYHNFTKAIPTETLKITGDLSITTIQVLDKDPIGYKPTTTTTEADLGKLTPSKNANKDPNTWKVVNMDATPELFKVVDQRRRSVAIDFRTKA